MTALAARVATPDDVDAVAETLTLAFKDDPVWGPYAFPDLGHARRIWRMAATIEMRFGASYVTDACEAVAIWIPPGEPEMTEDHEAEFEALAHELMGADQAGIALDAFELLDSNHPHNPPHYYLSLLATHDDHRGKGIGMALLADCLERVDAEHMPAYLESTNPANDARYMRHGFAPRGRLTLPNGHVITTMWREAR